MIVEQALIAAKEALEDASEYHGMPTVLNEGDTVIHVEVLQKLIEIAEDWKSMVGPLTAM